MIGRRGGRARGPLSPHEEVDRRPPFRGGPGLCLALALALALALLGTVASPARALAGTGGKAAAASDGDPEGRDAPRVEVWTFGPGDHPFTRFGHNAIRVVDGVAGLDVAYNFGTFAFGSPHLILDFLQGRLRYWLSFAGTAATARLYRRENRSIEIQELALTPAERRELARRLALNALPENRDYRYDYFADNCSTRVRDAIDGVLGGELRALARRPGQQSLRGNALRMTADEPWLYVALLIVLGPSTDRPIDEWAEDFLPEKLAQTMRDLRRRDGAGRAVPLVAAERVAFAADRPPVRREPPRWGLWFLAAGGLAGAALWTLGMTGARPGRRWARASFGVLVSLCGLLLGAIGCFLLGSWLLTPHAVVYRNQNLFLLPPFVIGLAGFGAGTLRGRARAARTVFWIAAVAAGLSLVALLVKLLPAAVIARQDNLSLIVACLPLWSGMALGARALSRVAGGALRARARAST